MKRFYIALAVIASCLWVWLPLAHTSQVRPVPDFDGNGVVDISDFLLFVGKFGSKQGDETYEDRFDLDGNGTVDISDFLIFVNDFGKVSPDSGDENDVNIPDANLRAVIADSLVKGRDNDNCIIDLSALSNLTNLTQLNLNDNRISDFSPLVRNTGFGSDDEVDVRKNPLSTESLNTHIPALQSRGVNVQFDNQPVLACVPILPKNLSVDAGTSHTLQTNYLYVDHEKISPKGRRVSAMAYADFNQDGHIDVFYAPGDGFQHNTFPAELYLNDGAGCFSLDTSFFNGNPPRRLAPRKALTGDFNGSSGSACAIAIAMDMWISWLMMLPVI